MTVSTPNANPMMANLVVGVMVLFWSFFISLLVLTLQEVSNSDRFATDSKTMLSGCQGFSRVTIFALGVVRQKQPPRNFASIPLRI
jgi:predicted metal-binding membrane protein